MRAPASIRLRPTLPIAAACVGLGSSNWVRLPTLLALLLVSAAIAGVVLPSERLRLAGAAVLCATGGLWWGGVRAESLDRSLLAPYVETSAEAVVAITGPTRRSLFQQRLPAEVRRIDGRVLRERTLLELPLGRSPPQGSLLALRVRIRAPRGPEDGFDERAWLGRRGVHVVLRGGEDWRIVGRRGGLAGAGDRLRSHLERTIAPGLSGDRRGVVAGIVLGEDEGLSEDLRADFRASGLYHLLAVSGQNVLFIGIGLAGLAWLLALPRLVRELAVLASIGVYVLAVGWQPSVVRAGVAGILASLAWLVARPSERWHVFGLGALVLLAWIPATLLDPGFQLSFAAVAAIFVAVPRIGAWLEGYPVPRVLREVIAVSTACGIATAPIVWLQFGTIPLYTVPANALAFPVAAPLLILGLLAAVVEPVLPSAAVALAWINGWLAAYLAWCAHAVAALPFSRVGSTKALAGIAAAVAALLLLRRLRGPQRLAAVLAGCAVAVVAATTLVGRAPPALLPPAGLRVVFLDVGQGDSALLQVAGGNVLVDEGPPEAGVARQLRRLGVRTLAAMVLTHPQRDHVGGAADVIRRLHVDTLLDPGLPVENGDERAALSEAHRRHVPVLLARAGGTYRIGRLRLQVLWPDGPGSPGADPNDHATVILASYGATDVLLTADAESDVTGRLPLRAIEVLKVAHHGSEDPGLPDELRILRPRIAVISVGHGNDYGHPRPQTVAALRAVSGLRLYRTDENGQVIVESDGRTLSVETAR